MKILTVGDAPDLKTGYGVTFKYIIKNLPGIDFASTCVNPRPGGYEDFQDHINKAGVNIYPATKAPDDRFGVKTFSYALNKEKPDLVFVSTDPYFGHHVFSPNRHYPTSFWVPIDGSPMPTQTRTIQGVVDWLHIFNSTDHLCVFTEWSKKVVQERVDRPMSVIPLGVDTEIFTPLTAEEIGIIKEKVLGIPRESFLLTSVARNQVRKQLDKNIKMAVRLIENENPDRPVYVYHHCKHDDKDGWDLGTLIRDHKHESRLLGTDGPQRFILNDIIPGLGMPPTGLAQVLAASDIMLLPSNREGFGIPIVEAMACGTPPIVTDYGAMAEVTGHDELLIEVPPNGLVYDRKVSTRSAFADDDDFYDKVHTLYTNEDRLVELGKWCRERACTEFDWVDIANKWKEIFKMYDNKGRTKSYNLVGEEMVEWTS